MQKIRTTVKIAGKEYNITGYDPAEHVQRVAEHVDRTMSELSLTTHLPPAQLAVLAAINATDDMIKSRDEIRRLTGEDGGRPAAGLRPGMIGAHKRARGRTRK